jgi:hypothetical protein
VARQPRRTIKEAQTNLSLMLFVVSIVPVAQLFLQRREPDWLVAAPISGQYLLLNRALRGEAIAPATSRSRASCPRS